MCMGPGLPAELSTHQRSWFWAKTVFWLTAAASSTFSHMTPTPPIPWLPWLCTSRRTWSALAGSCSLFPATPSSPSSERTLLRAWSWWPGTTAATCAISSCTCSLPRRESNLSTTWCRWLVIVFFELHLKQQCSDATHSTKSESQLVVSFEYQTLKNQGNSSNRQFQWFPLDFQWKWSKLDPNYARENALFSIEKNSEVSRVWKQMSSRFWKCDGFLYHHFLDTSFGWSKLCQISTATKCRVAAVMKKRNSYNFAFRAAPWIEHGSH